MLGDLAPDVVFANAAEAPLVVDGARPALLVVKDGPGPVLLHGADGHVETVAVTPVERVVDSTGAGDAFAGGLPGRHAGRCLAGRRGTRRRRARGAHVACRRGRGSHRRRNDADGAAVRPAMDLATALEFVAARHHGVLTTLKADGRPQLSNIAYDRR